MPTPGRSRRQPSVRNGGEASPFRKERVRIDVTPDWQEIAAIVEDGYRLVAPKKLLAELDG